MYKLNTHILCTKCKILVKKNIEAFCPKCKEMMLWYRVTDERCNIPDSVSLGRNSIPLSDLTASELAQIILCREA